MDPDNVAQVSTATADDSAHFAQHGTAQSNLH